VLRGGNTASECNAQMLAGVISATITTVTIVYISVITLNSH